jgi:hypothetical protein
MTRSTASFSRHAIAAAVLAATLSPAALASATEIHCPATIAQAPAAHAVPDDWVVRGAPAELALQRAAFYDGDPGGLGSLAPESTRRSGSTETSTWNFTGERLAPIWIGCLYRDGTTVVARRLPDSVRRCTTRLRVTAMGDPTDLLSVTCN